jgi:hypothetical protein
MGGVPAEPIKDMDRYFNEARRQNNILVKDGSV